MSTHKVPPVGQIEPASALSRARGPNTRRSHQEDSGRVSQASKSARNLPLDETRAADVRPGRPSPVPSTTGLHESYAKIRYDESSRQVLIQIINAVTGEIVREIPPEANQRLKAIGPAPDRLLLPKDR